MKKPLVSVIVPVYNEVNYIEPMVQSVLSQERKNYLLELVVVDGGSTDGTREKILELKQKNPSIRFIDNEKRITPSAFNKGIQHAGGDYIAILGAHSKYDSNYLDTCLEELQKNNCIACSGKVEVAKNNENWQSILVHCMLTSSFGVSGSSYRTAKEGVGEQCPYPVFQRSVFEEVGLYNETLIRNQDNDMNFRIRQKGHRLYYTHKVSAYYYPKQTIKSLLSYAIRTGKGNAVSLKVNASSLALRHIIPFIFSSAVIALITLSILSSLFISSMSKALLLLTIVILIAHLLIGFTQSVKSFIKTKVPAVFILPFLFFAFHFCYGWGTIEELIRNKKIN